jgi:UDP-N-acetylglucosamine 2-epimerase
MNRRIVDLIADIYFAPTSRAVDALRREGVAAEKIYLTGNTVVDALLEIAGQDGPSQEEDIVLITAHRRESFGRPLEGIVRSIARLARSFPGTRFVHVVHPNPNVRRVAEQNNDVPNVILSPPLDYVQLIHLLRRCRLVLTDSGGIQEEAPTFGKPVLVLREKTERPEGIEAGIARLVGTDEERIVEETSRLLSDDGARKAMIATRNPYGDGHASERITAVLSGRPVSVFSPESSQGGVA